MQDKSFPNYGCHADGCEGERCVLDPLSDFGQVIDPNNCDFCEPYLHEEFGYYNCPHWKLVEEKQTYFEHTCPKCGHSFDS